MLDKCDKGQLLEKIPGFNLCYSQQIAELVVTKVNKTIILTHFLSFQETYKFIF